MRERRGGADGAVVRAPPLRPHLGERVEEEDDVGVPLGVLLVDPELAAQRARAPVDAPDAVAGLPGAKIGELDPFAAHARDLVAGEDLRLERRARASGASPRADRRAAAAVRRTAAFPGAEGRERRGARTSSGPTESAPQRSQRSVSSIVRSSFGRRWTAWAAPSSAASSSGSTGSSSSRVAPSASTARSSR